MKTNEQTTAVAVRKSNINVTKIIIFMAAIFSSFVVCYLGAFKASKTYHNKLDKTYCKGYTKGYNQANKGIKTVYIFGHKVEYRYTK